MTTDDTRAIGAVFLPLMSINLEAGMKRILLASICALSLSCGSGPTGGGGFADEDYFPHQNTSSWTYDRVGSVDTLGGEYQFSGRRLETVTGLEEHGGADLILLTSVGYDTLYAAGMDSIFVPIGGVAALKIGDTGVWTYTDTLLTDSILIVQFPLAEGAQWMAHSNPDVYGEVTAMDETITVPEGTFDGVLHVSLGMDSLLLSMDQEFWFAPGVGCIRRVTCISAGGAVTLYELEESLRDHLVY